MFFDQPSQDVEAKVYTNVPSAVQDAWWIIQRVKQMKRPGLIANI